MKKSKLFFSFFAMILCLGLFSLKVSAFEATGTVSEPIQPVSIVTGDEDPTTFPSYDLKVPVATKSLVVPINMDYKGQLKINLLGREVSKSIDVNLYSDEACTSKIGYSGYLYSSSLEDDMKLDIPKKATYYLKFELSSYAESDATVSITPYSLSSEDKTLKNNNWVLSHPVTYNSQISNKITVEASGYIAVEGVSISDYGSVSVTLCNSKKANLSEQIYLSSTKDYTTYFAVKKGTYYIKSQSADDYKLRYKFTAVKDTSNTSKSKAISIGKGKTAKGLVLSEDSTSKADWYKVKLTSKRKLSFEIKAKSCDLICFEIIPASKNVILIGSTVRIYDAGGGVYSTQDSMPAGTYYIKVTKTRKTCSGNYSIKFK